MGIENKTKEINTPEQPQQKELSSKQENRTLFAKDLDHNNSISKPEAKTTAQKTDIPNKKAPEKSAATSRDVKPAEVKPPERKVSPPTDIKQERLNQKAALDANRAISAKKPPENAVAKTEKPIETNKKDINSLSYEEIHKKLATPEGRAELTKMNADFRERYKSEVLDASAQAIKTEKMEREGANSPEKDGFVKEASFTSETKNASSDVVQDYISQRNKEAEAYLNSDFGEAYKQLSEYMERKGYKAEDYNIYSKDPEWQSLQRALSPDCELPPIGSNEYCTTVNALRDANVSYRHIEPCDKQRTTEEIVKYLGGGDETEGSCSSLAFAYAGNKAGYEVLDFRDGESRECFSDFDTVCTIANLPEIDSKIVYGKNDIECAKELLGEMEMGKEYYLATGYHAAIVKKTEHGYEYLELQEPQNNGWENLDTKSLKERFGCETNQPKEYPNVLIDVESLGKSKEFLDILGYINTAESNQKKGVFGYGR